MALRLAVVVAGEGVRGQERLRSRVRAVCSAGEQLRGAVLSDYDGLLVVAKLLCRLRFELKSVPEDVVNVMRTLSSSSSSGKASADMGDIAVAYATFTVG